MKKRKKEQKINKELRHQKSQETLKKSLGFFYISLCNIFVDNRGYIDYNSFIIVEKKGEKQMSDPYPYIHRECESWLDVMTKLNPILSVMGPRQAGKTKLIMNYFPNLPYYDLEKEATRAMVAKGPEDFVRAHIDGLIIDEFHHIPELASAFKVVSDELIRAANARGEACVPTRFVITGSHNYLLAGDVKETMVGRVAIIDLPPMTGSELGKFDTAELMFKGGYPILHINGETPQTFFPKYIRSYLEREVRDIHHITDLIEFKNFMSFCANRIGTVLNYENMANSLDVPVEKIKDWLSILEASYIIFRAPPYYNNFEKRLVKRPKLYFYDTGLAAYFLDVKSSDALMNPESRVYGLRGKLFENLCFSEIKKKLLNKGFILDSAYFWNVEKGEENPYEVDLLLNGEYAIKTVEIKASDKLQSNWFHGGAKLGEMTKVQKYVIYNGPTLETEDGIALNFKDLDRLFEEIRPSSKK